MAQNTNGFKRVGCTVSDRAYIQRRLREVPEITAETLSDELQVIKSAVAAHMPKPATDAAAEQAAAEQAAAEQAAAEQAAAEQAAAEQAAAKSSPDDGDDDADTGEDARAALAPVKAKTRRRRATPQATE